MSGNPYAPPSTQVVDIDAGVSIPRPRVVQVALVLCWVSLVIELPLIPEQFVRDQLGSGPGVLLVAFVLFYVALTAFAILVNVSIGRARNWARIVYAVLTGLNLIPMFGSFSELMAQRWYAWSISLLATAMDVVVVVLLFTPAANAWYRVRGRRPVGSAA